MPQECSYIIDFIKKQFKNRGRADDFIYYGKVSEEFKTGLLTKAKVLFHPARDEPFGIAIVEGMAAGAIQSFIIQAAYRIFGKRKFI